MKEESSLSPWLAYTALLLAAWTAVCGLDSLALVLFPTQTWVGFFIKLSIPVAGFLVFGVIMTRHLRRWRES